MKNLFIIFIILLIILALILIAKFNNQLIFKELKNGGGNEYVTIGTINICKNCGDVYKVDSNYWQKFLQNQHLDIICLQENYDNIANNVANFLNYKVIYDNTNDTAIIYNQQFEDLIPYIACVHGDYHHYGDIHYRERLNYIKNLLDSRKDLEIIAGDFNEQSCLDIGRSLNSVDISTYLLNNNFVDTYKQKSSKYKQHIDYTWTDYPWGDASKIKKDRIDFIYVKKKKYSVINTKIIDCESDHRLVKSKLLIN